MKKYLFAFLILLIALPCHAFGPAILGALSAGGAAAASITFRTSGSDVISLTTSPVVTKPAGTVDGDFILVAFVTDAVHVVNSVIAGWTQIGTTQVTGTDTSVTLVYKRASSEGASWTFTDLFTASHNGIAGVIVYDGVNASVPLDVAVVQGAGTNNTVHAAGPITPTSANCMIVSFFGADPGGEYTGTPDDSPACTEKLEVTNGTVGFLYAQEHLQTAAAEETHQVTISSSDLTSWFIVALRPE